MKKFFLSTLVLCFASSHMVAQITTIQTKNDVPQELEQPVQYDITKNFLGDKNVENYVGQTLYVAGKSATGYGYDNFFTKREGSIGDRWGRPSEKSPYNTRYEDLYGKSFVVEAVYKAQWHSSFHYWWFLLREKDHPQVTAWFKYKEDFENEFPFVVVSHFEYVKENYIGKKYVTEFWERPTFDREKQKFGSDTYTVTRIQDEDIHTGQLIRPSLSDVWECIDVTLADNSSSVYLVVKNQKNQTSLLATSSLGQQANGTYWVYEKSDYDRYVARFGAGNMNKIRQRKIAVGMTTEMLKLAWGEPKRINTSSHGPDQWVYDGQYVYVTNGKITAWN